MTSIHDHGLHQTSKQIPGKKKNKRKMVQNTKKAILFVKIDTLGGKKIEKLLEL